jgi:hypothetical protein
MDKKFLYPIIKFRSAETYPEKSQEIPAVVVRLQDFLQENGTPKTSEIQKVQRVGSLCEYLNFTGRIILSPIIPDSILEKINYDTYVYLIEALQPDQYITPDGPTYFRCTKVSRNQIELILGMTGKLLDRFPECIPIGLVKGSNLSQMDFHLDNLLELGLTQICLHAGDALYKEPHYAKDQVVDYARHIREKVPHLMIYGVGSKHYFRRFYFADSYATNSHFIQAFNHKVIRGATWVTFKGEPTREIIMQNFDYLRRLVESQNDIRKLSAWITVKSEAKSSERIAENTTLDRRILKILEG